MEKERERLVLENQGLIEKVMRCNCVPREFWDDVRQEAEIGLIHAARSYNPRKGVRFSTYAWVCIRNQVVRAVTLKSLRGYGMASLNRHAFAPTEFLDEFFPSDVGVEQTLGTIFDSEFEEQDFLNRALRILPSRMEKVIRMRYGLEPYKASMSCAEVGERLRISPGSVSYLAKKAIRMMRDYAERTIID
ncbi:sigma-70 family RNA polymerase sigma factor [Candidatus Pacearchaeota archaeon]|nr:MAG: sigma-70 family RNA polymerase sigma factor [Candidatus Pacearchaeota archaeon]